MKWSAMILAALALAAPAAAKAAAPEKPVSVVLVHGAWVDGSGWRAVHDALQKDGYEVLVVQNPTVTLQQDVAATEHVIAAAHHPVFLVGHSYGGVVISQAGNDPKVVGLGFVAAFAPDAGESVHDIVSKPKPPGTPSAPTLPPKDGFVTLDPAKMSMDFAGDVDPAAGRFLADSQVPWGVAAMMAKVGHAAWRTKPSFFLMTTNDRIIPPASQREMAERAHAKVTPVPSSHAVMFSHPAAVVAFIEAAAKGS